MKYSKSDITITYDKVMGWFVEEFIVENKNGKPLQYLCERSLSLGVRTGEEVLDFMCEKIHKFYFYKNFFVNICVIDSNLKSYRKTIDRTAEV